MQKRAKPYVHTYRRWIIIKNSVEDVSDERAVDAFSAGLRRSDLVEELGRIRSKTVSEDLVEELGRIRSKTVSELIEIASRFADGENAYNNKRARSPEVDRATRLRHRSHNEDSRIRRNQVAAGYERRNEEGDESREYRDKNSRGREKPSIQAHRRKTCSMDPATSTTCT
jgi:hypothetical protein